MWFSQKNRNIEKIESIKSGFCRYSVSEYGIPIQTIRTNNKEILNYWNLLLISEYGFIIESSEQLNIFTEYTILNTVNKLISWDMINLREII